MKINSIFIMMAGVLFCTSCATTVSTYTSRTVDINTKEITASPVVVDVDVDVTKPMVTCTETYKLRSLAPATTKSALEATYHDCLLKNKIHILVDPIYKTELNGRGEVTVTVSGLGGYYKNSRTLIEDIKTYQNINTDAFLNYIMINNPGYLQNCINYYRTMHPDAPIKIIMDGETK